MRLYLMCCFLSFLSLALGNNGDVSICCQACDCLFVNWSKMSALKNNAFHVCGLERLVLEMANSQQSRVPSAGPLGMGAGPWVNYDRYIYTSSSLLNHAVTIAQVEGWGQRLLLLVWSLFVAGLCSSGSTKRNPVTRHKRCLFGPWCLNIRSHLVASQAVQCCLVWLLDTLKSCCQRIFINTLHLGTFWLAMDLTWTLLPAVPEGSPRERHQRGGLSSIHKK